MVCRVATYVLLKQPRCARVLTNSNIAVRPLAGLYAAAARPNQVANIADMSQFVHPETGRIVAEDMLKSHGLRTGVFLLRRKNETTTVLSICTDADAGECSWTCTPVLESGMARRTSLCLLACPKAHLPSVWPS